MVEAFAARQSQQPVGNILILDHLNINHEKGRHDWLKSFYFDFLNLSVDPRKQENLESGRKTLWANAAAQQFHLPEGKPDAQVLEGVITLSYPDFGGISDRLEAAKKALKSSKFDAAIVGDEKWKVTDPWGNQFRIVTGEASERDTRGQQSGPPAEGLAMRDLTIYTATSANLPGIARFYRQILDAPILRQDTDHVVVSVGPLQTLTFRRHPDGSKMVSHEDMRDEHVEAPEGFPSFQSNYGPHVSMYVADFKACYKKADKLNLTYVNPRFSRRAYTLEQAVDDCMFRVLDIKDPENPDDGTILRLEHEVRSVIKRDGSKYKSCPFDEIPKECLSIS